MRISDWSSDVCSSDLLRELIRQHDAPVYTITYFAQWDLMRAVRQGGYKVSVSGTGADELFSGYFDHHNAYLAAMAASDPARHAEALVEWRSEEHTSELQSLMRISYAVFCLTKKTQH